MASATQPVVHLTPEEAVHRRRAVASAVGSLRIEGMEPDEKELEIVERYASGTIGLGAMHAEMNAYIEAEL
jgi:hypothetical protein